MVVSYINILRAAGVDGCSAESVLVGRALNLSSVFSVTATPQNHIQILGVSLTIQ
jgi:hypothetical protein